MRFLIDQQLPQSLARWIQTRGHDALHVKTLGLNTATDHELWRLATAENRFIVTKDEDFAGIVRRGVGPSVIWVRLGNCSNSLLMWRMEHVWEALLDELSKGSRLVEVR